MNSRDPNLSNGVRPQLLGFHDNDRDGDSEPGDNTNEEDGEEGQESKIVFEADLERLFVIRSSVAKLKFSGFVMYILFVLKLRVFAVLYLPYHMYGC